MPRLNHTGPEGLGSGTGRKLGLCRQKDSAEKMESGELGKGMGMRRHAESRTMIGKGRRLKYFQEK